MVKKEKDEFTEYESGVLPHAVEPSRENDPKETHTKFHLDGFVWKCNICNDLGKLKYGKMVCQGCGASE